MIVRFDKHSIDHNLPGIIIMSHSSLALGMINAVEMIVGHQENVAVFCYEVQDSIEEYRTAFEEAFDAFPEGSFAFVDLLGGSPCNQLSLKLLNSNKKIHAFAGMNLPMLLEACLSRSCLASDELAIKIKTIENNGMVCINDRFNQKISKRGNINETSEDYPN